MYVLMLAGMDGARRLFLFAESLPSSCGERRHLPKHPAPIQLLLPCIAACPLAHRCAPDFVSSCEAKLSLVRSRRRGKICRDVMKVQRVAFLLHVKPAWLSSAQLQ